jgi:hypothetical protein
MINKVEIASTYLEDVAYIWYNNERATLTTFDLFKSTLRDHFVPQNYKDVAYRRYKTLTQGILSVSDYSIQLKTLADQISDLVPPATRDLDFVNGLRYRIKQFIVAQPPIVDEKWSGLVGRALRQEETLPADYNRVSKAAPPSDTAQHGVSRNQNNSRSTSRSGNWRTKSPSSGNKPSTSSSSNATSQKLLDPLSDAERDFLRKHQGISRPQ